MDHRLRADSLSDRRKKPEPPDDNPKEPRYHVYIRLPFNRPPGFVEPGTVNWNEKKSDALWSVLSKSSIETVDWARLASEFDVSVDFLLQMANYLTEHHTSQLRAHMQRVAAAYGSAAPSPVPGAEPGSPFPGATEPMRRMPSGAGRAPSALSVRRDMASPTTGIEEEPRAAGGLGITLKGALVSRPGSSRTSSTATPVPGQPGSRPGTAVRLSNLPSRRFPRLATSLQQQQHPPTPTGPQQEGDETEIAPPSPAASTATSSSSSSDSPVQSRIIRRPPRFQPSKDTRGGAGPYGVGDPDDADDDDEPAFLPFARSGNPAIAHHVMPSVSTTSSEGSGQDLGETLRGGFSGGPGIGRRPVGMTSAAAAGAGASALPTIDGVQSQSQTSDSSIGSTAVVRRPVMTAVGGAGGNPGGDNSRRTPLSANTAAAAAAAGQGVGGPLSPRRMAELAGRGSRHRSMLKEESDGTPSMGSSFSDLDDASVTQSALEEALASRMQDGTIGSRMSVIGGTIGQAFRSRYLPKPNRQ